MFSVACTHTVNGYKYKEPIIHLLSKLSSLGEKEQIITNQILTP